MEKQTKKREVYIDIARGIAIICMILGHSIQKGAVLDTIYSFHMPLFIIVSGMFFKEDRSIISLKKWTKTLIYAYIFIIITNYIYFIIHNISIVIATEEIIKKIMLSYSTIGKLYFNAYSLGEFWFIPLLFIVKVLFIINRKITNNNSICLFLLIVLETYIGYLLGVKGYFLPFSLDVALFSMIFYYIGYILKNSKIIEQLLNKKKALIIIFIIWILGIKLNPIELFLRRYTYGLFCAITAISGTLIIFKLSRKIEEKNIISTGVLSWYGRNSMYILASHYAERLFINYNSVINFSNKNLNGIIVFIINVLIATISTYIFINIKEKLKNKNEELNE